ncbi:9-O-acetylesterase [Bifidobacterium imperatoris]|uniref:9-O-acetylesterase n=1 Tax=Bifidobacterium imperatoris TaxID=2020965 RepID=A0A2N5IQY1_9BIFI|nr:sialate O-acetylesterase [Bifidobacterium imperatoris]PLS24365.1 9-O-acetylesterase [Bifidobacterium imperatoris]QSY56936.1 9-O-acetylesterase [Bifidobacterium imperatoris]
MLRLPKLLDDGCVLQSSMPVAIWGWAEPGCRVSVGLQGQTVAGTADRHGSWSVELDPLTSGGPYTLSVQAEDSERMDREVYVGEVYLCAGQSNMELPMAWVKAEYPGEFKREPDALLRQYKVAPRYDFEGPRQDHEQAAWSVCDEQGLPGFSAIGYFFGRMLREHLGVPVGLLNVSLGGSPIESWMSAESLQDFPEILQTLQPYMGKGVAEARSRKSIAARDHWYRQLGYDQAPQTGSWLPLGQWDWQHDTSVDTDPKLLQWRSMSLPNFFSDQGLAGFRGELELRKTIYLPASADGQPASLQLGTMSDAEHTWLNGQLLGGRTNQYEPRDYSIPAGVLREGRNELLIRLVCEHDAGRVTPGKAMTMAIGDDVHDLGGRWRYAVLHEADQDCPWEDFVRWKPVGLYNAMLAPCLPYRIRAVLWYQGESNTGDWADLYRDMLASMIGMWRVGWNQERLPFLIVQLPNFAIDCVGEDGGWPVVREAQWEVSQMVPDAATVVTLDAGDWNDLHPAHKKPIAERLFQAARQLVYGEPLSVRQPRLAEAKASDGSMVLTFGDCPIASNRVAAATAAESAPSRISTIDGHEPGEFTFVWSDGGTVSANATIEGSQVTLSMPSRTPDELRYAWRNNPDDGLLCNEYGVLVAPFRLRLRDLAAGWPRQSCEEQ